MNFTEQKFNITVMHLETGESFKQERWGYVADGTGLAYYENLDNEGKENFVPIHLASGFALGIRFYSEVDCKVYIEAIAPLMDWNQEAKAIFEEPELFPKIRKIASKIIQGDRSRIAKNFKTEISKAIIAKSKELSGVQQ